MAFLGNRLILSSVVKFLKLRIAAKQLFRSKTKGKNFQLYLLSSFNDLLKLWMCPWNKNKFYWNILSLEIYLSFNKSLLFAYLSFCILLTNLFFVVDFINIKRIEDLLWFLFALYKIFELHTLGTGNLFNIDNRCLFILSLLFHNFLFIF